MEPAESRLARLAQRLRSTKPGVIDAVLGTLFTIAAPLSILGDAGDTTVKYHDTDALAVALAFVVAVPYFFRRRAPLPVFLIGLAPVVFLTARDYQVGVMPTILLVGMYTVAAYCSLRERVVAVVCVAAGLLVIAVSGSSILHGIGIALEGALFLAAYLFGATVRNRRLYSEQVVAREALLEREHDEEAKRAVSDERLRIAQELHDVVAHSMGVIAVQAGVGAHVIDDDPAEAKKALLAISHTSRSTLTELRRLLGVLRDDTGAEYAPAPGLENLDQLAADLDAAGVPVDIRVEGSRCELPPGVNFTAYRIVQEGLTNVLKHAGPAHASVIVGYEPGVLQLEVIDDGRGVNGRSSGSGHGLVGMRERVGVYGGSLDAGPRPGGGFRVVARLPYGEPE